MKKKQGKALVSAIEIHEALADFNAENNVTRARLVFTFNTPKDGGEDDITSALAARSGNQTYSVIIDITDMGANDAARLKAAQAAYEGKQATFTVFSWDVSELNSDGETTVNNGVREYISLSDPYIGANVDEERSRTRMINRLARDIETGTLEFGPIVQEQHQRGSKMEYIKTEIEGVWVIEPKVFNDQRGYFFEAFKQAEFDEHIGYHVEFIQDNESKSSFGVLRGLHYQKGENSQAKLVRVIKGKVIDVAVDLRKSSPTFGKYVLVELSEDNKRQFFIPRGFAHGFLVLSEEAIFTYKVDNVYAPQSEASIRWNDEFVDIKWPVEAKDVLLSEKDDAKSLAWEDAEKFE